MGRLTGPGQADIAPRKARSGAPFAAGLADALFTATQQRVLGLLFGHPDRSFYVTEILTLTRGGTGALQRELGRLSAAGLITARRIGNQLHYQANPDSPLFHEIVQIVRKTVGAGDALFAALQPIAGRVQLALLYGSAAKGVDTAASDLDLLVVSDTLTLEELYRTLVVAEASLGRKIQPTLYTTAEFSRRRQTDDSFVNRVLAGGTLALVGDLDAVGATRKSRPHSITED